MRAADLELLETHCGLIDHWVYERREEVEQHEDLVQNVNALPHAGMIFKDPNGDGFHLAEVREKDLIVYADAGGARKETESAWDAACRQALVVTGIDARHALLKTEEDIWILRNAKGELGVVFLVDGSELPYNMTRGTNLRKVSKTTGSVPQGKLHSRLRYAAGIAGKLRNLL